MSLNNMPTNIKLARFHRLFAIPYLVMSFLALAAALAEYASVKASSLNFLIMLLCLFSFMGFMHWAASIQVKRGTQAGRMISRFVGALLLIGFPIGTILGIWVLKQSSRENYCLS